MSIHWSVQNYETISSTQDLIKEQALSGAPEGSVVHALMQSGGRGRHGRAWISQEGNLFFSLLLRPETGLETIGQLGLLIGVALGEALQEFLQGHVSVFLKWPNDVLLDEKKCSGILIETEINKDGALDFVTVGCGVNIEVAPEGGTFLNAHTHQDLNMVEVRDQILEKIDFYYTLWQRDGFPAIQSSWLKMTCQKGSPVQVRLGDQVIVGAFEGVDAQGALLLHDSQTNELKAITAGEVYLGE